MSLLILLYAVIDSHSSFFSPSPQYDTDFYVLDKYPLAVRPFYTMPDPSNPVSLSLTHQTYQTHQPLKFALWLLWAT